MDIETIEAIARQKISLTAVRPSRNYDLFVVEFSSDVTVHLKEIHRFKQDESDHFHSENNCRGCNDMFSRGVENGVALGIRKVDRGTKIGRTEILRRVKAKPWYTTKEELVNYMVSLVDDGIS